VVRRGATFVARFRFRLPYLPTGVYALEAMLFDADRPGERPMCRYEDANFLRIESSHISHGLVNIAMRAIEIQVGGADETAGDGVGRVHFG
jgi:lipopolysaccharide transport system ATP-binding protein